MMSEENARDGTETVSHPYDENTQTQTQSGLGGQAHFNTILQEIERDILHERRLSARSTNWSQLNQTQKRNRFVRTGSSQDLSHLVKANDTKPDMSTQPKSNSSNNYSQDSIPASEVTKILTQALQMNTNAMSILKNSRGGDREVRFIQRVKHRGATLTTDMSYKMLRETLNLAQNNFELSFAEFSDCIPDIADKHFKSWFERNEFTSYAEVMYEFRDHMIPESHNLYLKKRLMSSKQGSRDVVSYLNDTCQINQELESPFSEKDLVEILVEGLKPELRVAIGVGIRRTTLKKLETDCKVGEKLLAQTNKSQISEIAVEALKCFNCGDTGHFIRNCPKPKPNTAPQTIENQLSAFQAQLNKMQEQMQAFMSNFGSADRERGAPWSDRHPQ